MSRDRRLQKKEEEKKEFKCRKCGTFQLTFRRKIAEVDPLSQLGVTTKILGAADLAGSHDGVHAILGGVVVQSDHRGDAFLRNTYVPLLTVSFIQSEFCLVFHLFRIP